MIGTVLVGESAEGTIVTTVGPRITDAAGNVYSISSTGYVVTNGQPETTISANVVELVYHAPVIVGPRQLYQKNSSGLWYTRTSVTSTYTGPVADPTMLPSSPLSSFAASPGPGASSSFIVVDCSAPTSNILQPTLFGSSMARDVDFTPWSDATLQSTAKNTMGFGLPGMYCRINCENQSQNSDGSANLTYVDRVTAAMKNIIDVNNGEFSYGLGYVDGSGNTCTPAQTAAGAVDIYNRFRSNGLICRQYEVFNEFNGYDINLACQTVNAVADALHSLDSAVRIIALNDSFEVGDRLAALAQQCGTKVARYHYHSYLVDPTFSDISAFNSALSGLSGAASDLRSRVGNSIPAGIGEYSLDGNPGEEPRSSQIQGAIYNSLALYAAFTADPLHTHGAIWDWYGDGTYGLIGPTGYPAYGCAPVGYAYKNCRQYMGGTTVPVSLPSGNIKGLATVNGGRVSLWLINYDDNNSFSGQVAFNRWPVNATGNGTLTRLEVSGANLQSSSSTLSITNGVTSNVTIPALSCVVITSG